MVFLCRRRVFPRLTSVKFGPYQLYSIETAHFGIDGGAMFGSVPKPLWEKTNPADDRNRIDLTSRSLLLVGEGKRILVDTGIGTKYSAKWSDIYRLDTRHHPLIDSLRARGCQAEDITDVILTHLHFDHAGGATTVEEGKLRPTFPNATYHVQKAHWEHAMNPTERDRASFLPDDFLPLKERGQLRLLDGPGELFPNVRVVVMHGHTTAWQMPIVSDGNATLLFCGELFATISHVQLPYIMGYDLRPLTTLEEKKRFLPGAVVEKWILFFQHDPRIVAGKATKTEKGFAFSEEVEMA